MKAVLTTINPPTEAVKKLASLTDIIVIGDEKTPRDWYYEGAKYYPIHEQKEMDFSLNHYLPDNHYSRKNLGYLLAMQDGTELIYDTDDDNCPNENWKIREINNVVESITKEGCFNVYGQTYIDIWPRGFPLKHLSNVDIYGEKKEVKSLIQQGLSDGNPDVDAIWRLTRNFETKFDDDKSFHLNKFTWCPFNSQSTWWFPQAYPLMYLPVYATFRMTDIWRSFVAQRCLWEMGFGVVFHSPAEVYQDRNPHDLLKDFKDEIPGYLKNDLIVETLSGLTLGKDIYENMVTCYQSLVDKDILPEMEMRSLNAWIKDVQKIWKKKT